MPRDRAPPIGALAVPRPPGIYKATLKSYTHDGTISRELQAKRVNFQRKQLKVEKEITPQSVYDFTYCGRSTMSVKKPDNENENSS